MKWIALVRIFDSKLAGEWHSGSCTTVNAKPNLTKAEAQAYIKEITDKYEGYNKNRNEYHKYRLTTCILQYSEKQNESVEAFFKYMA